VQPEEAPLRLEDLPARHPIVERRVLQRHTDRKPHVVGIVDHVETTDAGATRTREQQRAQHAHHRGLAGTVRPQEAVDLAFAHLEIDPVDRREVAESPDEALCTNCTHGPGRYRTRVATEQGSATADIVGA
jgi:hypothetical protein